MQSPQDIWNNCLKFIKDNVEPETYKALFAKLVPLRIHNTTLTLQAPSHFIIEYLEEHYIALLRTTLRKEMGDNAKLEYSIVMAEKPQSPVAGLIASAPANKPLPLTNQPVGMFNPFAMPGMKRMNIDPRLNPKYAFENFIEGPCNALARNAGLTVAQQPGATSFNPFFIHGGSGLGKTHLAQAIGIEVKKLHPEKVVLYASAYNFCEQYTSAVQRNSVNDFLHFYQQVDVLILDDIHDFAGKVKTQETFFHLFDHLQQAKKQIVLTADKAPADIAGLEQRILSRLKWGLTVELTQPDYNTRLKIYTDKVRKDGINMDERIIAYLAETVTNNVREFEGVLNGLLAEATYNRRSISMEMAINIVNRNIRNSKHELTVDTIYKKVCNYLNIASENVQSKTRKREIVLARQIAMFFSKKYTKTSLASIGAQIGGKNHATVLHACKAVANLIETDHSFSDMIGNIEKQLKAAM